jgi:hypothetical protein
MLRAWESAVVSIDIGHRHRKEKLEWSSGRTWNVFRALGGCLIAHSFDLRRASMSPSATMAIYLALPGFFKMKLKLLAQFGFLVRR